MLYAMTQVHDSLRILPVCHALDQLLSTIIQNLLAGLQSTKSK